MHCYILGKYRNIEVNLIGFVGKQVMNVEHSDAWIVGLGVLKHAINSKTKIRPVIAFPWSPPISLSHIRVTREVDLLCVECMEIGFCTLEIDS